MEVIGQIFRFLNRKVTPICVVTGGSATPTLTPAPESDEIEGLVSPKSPYRRGDSHSDPDPTHHLFQV